MARESAVQRHHLIRTRGGNATYVMSHTTSDFNGWWFLLLVPPLVGPSCFDPPSPLWQEMEEKELATGTTLQSATHFTSVLWGHGRAALTQTLGAVGSPIRLSKKNKGVSVIRMNCCCWFFCYCTIALCIVLFFVTCFIPLPTVYHSGICMTEGWLTYIL